MGKNNQIGQIASIAAMAVASYFGGPMAGQIAYVAVSMISQRLATYDPIEGSRRENLNGLNADYGVAIPEVFGYYRVAGNVIWCKDLKERVTEDGGKGKRGQKTYKYYANFACLLCNEQIVDVRRIWANGKLIYSKKEERIYKENNQKRGILTDHLKEKMGKTGENLGIAANLVQYGGKNKDFVDTIKYLKHESSSKINSGYGNFEIFYGTKTQESSTHIESFEGKDNVEAYRNIAYIVFKDFELTEFGNTIPSLSFEIVKDDVVVDEKQDKLVIKEFISSDILINGMTDEVKKYFATDNNLDIKSFVKRNNDVLVIANNRHFTIYHEEMSKYKIRKKYLSTDQIAIANSTSVYEQDFRKGEMLNKSVLVLNFNLKTKQTQFLYCFFEIEAVLSELLETTDGYDIYCLLRDDTKKLRIHIDNNLTSVSSNVLEDNVVRVAQTRTSGISYTKPRFFDYNLDIFKTHKQRFIDTMTMNDLIYSYTDVGNKRINYYYTTQAQDEAPPNDYFSSLTHTHTIFVGGKYDDYEPVGLVRNRVLLLKSKNYNTNRLYGEWGVEELLLISFDKYNVRNNLSSTLDSNIYLDTDALNEISVKINNKEDAIKIQNLLKHSNNNIVVSDEFKVCVMNNTYIKDEPYRCYEKLHINFKDKTYKLVKNDEIEDISHYGSTSHISYVDDDVVYTYINNYGYDQICLYSYNINTNEEKLKKFNLDVSNLKTSTFGFSRIITVNNKTYFADDKTVYYLEAKTVSDNLTNYLSIIIKQLMKKGGFKHNEFDVSDIEKDDRKIRGFIINSASSIKDTLNNLSNIFSFNAVEKDDKIYFKYKSDKISAYLSEEDLGEEFYSDEIDFRQMYKKDTTKNLEIPNEISLNFVDENLEYGNNSVQANTYESEGRITREISTALSLNVNSAQTIVENLINNLYSSNETLETSLSIEYDYLNINDIVAIYFEDEKLLKTYNIAKKQKDKTLIKLTLISCNLIDVHKNIEYDNFYQYEENDFYEQQNLYAHKIKLNRLIKDIDTNEYTIAVDYDKDEKNEDYYLFIQKDENKANLLSNKRVDTVNVFNYNIKQLTEIEKQNYGIDKESYIIIKKSEVDTNEFVSISLQEAVDNKHLNAFYFKNEVMRYLTVTETENEIKLTNFIRYVKDYNTFNYQFNDSNLLINLYNQDENLVDVDLNKTEEKATAELEGQYYYTTSLVINNTVNNKLYELTKDNFVIKNNKVIIQNLLNPFVDNQFFEDNSSFVIKKSTNAEAKEEEILESYETKSKSFIIENIENYKVIYIKHKVKDLETEFFKILL